MCKWHPEQYVLPADVYQHVFRFPLYAGCPVSGADAQSGDSLLLWQRFTEGILVISATKHN